MGFAICAPSNNLTEIEIYKRNESVLCVTKLNFIIRIFLQPDGVNHLYLNFRLFDLTDI